MRLLVNAKAQTGAALLLVIMITAIMAIVMTLMIHQSRLDMRLAFFVKKQAVAEMSIQQKQAELIFEFISTPLHLVGPNYMRDRLSLVSSINNFKGKPIQQEKITISVQEASGLISLLPFDEKSFNRFLLAQGQTKEYILAFKDRLDDWEDPDNLTRLQGREKGDYSLSPYFPANQSLQSVNEMKYLLENDLLFEAIKPFLVLYSQGIMNRQFTPESLYLATGLEQTVSKEYSASSGSAEGPNNYPSGNFLITLSYLDNGVSLDKHFILLRGQETYQPFFVINEKYF